MGKTVKWLTLLICVIGVMFCVIRIYNWYKASKSDIPVARIEPARIVDVRPMVELCTMEIYEDVPVKAHIGKRHIFARETLTGSISFDVDSIHTRWRGDTLVVTLPPEKVAVYESTDSGSYKVIDTWNEQWLRSSNFTTVEENDIKRKVVDAWRLSLYDRGYVKRARKDAVKNLEGMLRPFVDGKEVRVEDPAPAGYREGLSSEEIAAQ